MNLNIDRLDYEGKQLIDLPCNTMYVLATIRTDDPPFLLFKTNHDYVIKISKQGISVHPMNEFVSKYIPYTGKIQMSFIDGL